MKKIFQKKTLKVFIYGKSYAEIPDYIGKVLLSKEKVTF